MTEILAIVAGAITLLTIVVRYFLRDTPAKKEKVIEQKVNKLESNIQSVRKAVANEDYDKVREDIQHTINRIRTRVRMQQTNRKN